MLNRLTPTLCRRLAYTLAVVAGLCVVGMVGTVIAQLADGGAMITKLIGGG